MITIGIVNQKGGVAKSTTACTLAKDLATRGSRVLIIDLDSQCNTSYIMHADTAGKTIHGVLYRELDAATAIQHGALDIISASPHNSEFDGTTRELGQEHRLREAILELHDKYDYVIIDTPPSLGLLMFNAIVASDYIVIPCQADTFSFQGMTELLKTVSTAIKYSNPTLKVAGVLFTRHNERTKISKGMRQMFTVATAKADIPIFNTTIREAVAIKEAQSMLQTVIEYSPDSEVAKDYIAFTDELLAFINKSGK